MTASWAHTGVIYQIYPRSFGDTNGDGVGDLPGITRHLDYLSWLGVDALWLNPTMPSPNADWGYDVSDYKGVHPELGTMADLDELLTEAHRRNLRVLLDLVPNHTSDQHPWFRDAISSPHSRHRDWYVWARPGRGGGPPNNWLNVFKGSAWTFDEKSSQYYLHNYTPRQPDLNWWNPEVREAFDEILGFWFDRGVDGFRIDVAHAIIKDRQLRDNVPVSAEDHWYLRRLGQRQTYNMNRPEVHEVLRRWRAIADRYRPPRVLVGETFVLDVPSLAAFYGSGEDELHLAFNFPFIYGPLEAPFLSRVVEEVERLLPEEAWPIWAGSNHDVGRFPTRWAGGRADAARCALLMLLTLRGAVSLYYGDELGLTDVPIPQDRILDPIGRLRWPDDPGRDRARTPMPWTDEPGLGCTLPGVEPWLPCGDRTGEDVQHQGGDPNSTLHLTRDLLSLRREREDLERGGYSPLEAGESVWAWRRGESTLVALNLSDEAAGLDGVAGKILIATARNRDGEGVAGSLELPPWQGAIVAEE